MSIVIAALAGVVVGVIATRLYYEKAVASLREAEQNARAKLKAKI